MAEYVFCLPDLAEGLEDAEIVEWRVAEGDHVELNQPLGEVQTAKAAVEIPSPRRGTVRRLHAQPGELVRVGEPLCTFDVDPEPGTPDSAGVVGRIPTDAGVRRRVRLRPPGGT